MIATPATRPTPRTARCPPSALNWKIVFHHDTHIHPVIDGATGGTGSVTIPTTGHSFKGDTSYEIVLTATDSNGIQASQLGDDSSRRRPTSRSRRRRPG